MPNVGNMFGIAADQREFPPSPDFVSNTLVGIEVEVEGIGRGLRQKELPHWSIVNDGSLRNNGAEFVSAYPICGANLSDSLKTLEKELTDNNAILNERTGLHVHVDVRNLSVKALQNFILLCLVLEKPLIRFSGGRAVNNFCVPLKDAFSSMNSLHNLMIDRINHAVDGCEKYVTINFNAVGRFGSVEFRTHKGTYSAAEITAWVNILLSIRKYSESLQGKGQDLLNIFSGQGPHGLLSEIFSPEQLETFVYAGIEDDMYEGLSVGQQALLHGRQLHSKKKKRVTEAERVEFFQGFTKAGAKSKGKKMAQPDEVLLEVPAFFNNNFAEDAPVDPAIPAAPRPLGGRAREIQEAMDRHMERVRRDLAAREGLNRNRNR